MSFLSILGERDHLQLETANQPDFFPDLNLDEIVDNITKPKQEYNLKPFFWTPLGNVEAILYRQEVMRDLENQTVMNHIKTFSAKMSSVRRYLEMANKLDYDYHRKGWILEAALLYCEAVMDLNDHLANTSLCSHGLLTFREYLQSYLHSPGVQSLLTEAQEVKRVLSAVQYCVLIGTGKFKVKKYEGETDYSPEVEKTFAKFKQRDAQDYVVKLPERAGMNHIEAKILEFVTRLYPAPFAFLDDFCAQHTTFVDEIIQSFEREIQFYVAYLDFIADLKQRGLPFCYPEVSALSKEIEVRDSFDLALAQAQRQREQPIVLNDFFLHEPEHILIVTGPNQGGKTTFAHMFGQVHYLASLGCPIPGRKARLFLFDRIFTHFEQGEDIQNLRGKLEDDLIRIHEMLARGTANSIFILNEIFTSTTFQDAFFLSKEIMARLMDLDALVVWVTFLDELASMTAKAVSMVAMVDMDDPTIRTFKVVRRPANGLAYALSLAQKYGLTYEQIMERLP